MVSLSSWMRQAQVVGTEDSVMKLCTGIGEQGPGQGSRDAERKECHCRPEEPVQRICGMRV